MEFLYGLLIFSFAGVINGSFALPSKKLTHWPYQRIWLNYSIWSFFIFPVLFISLLAPVAWKIYWHAPAHLLTIIFIGGLLFGLGQICFARALHLIGLSLGFFINISIGTALGSCIPLILFHTRDITTPAGIITLIGVAVIIIGIFLSYIAGIKRDQHNIAQTPNTYLGILLAAIAGVFSAGQNITFSYTASLQQQALQAHVSHLAAANIIWPLFLLATFLPYAGYMLYLHTQNKTTTTHFRSIRYYGATMIMGACWFFSLILYSAGSLKIGALGPVIGWPLFMVSIILSSALWGWRSGEWNHASSTSKRIAKISIGTLIIAIIILGYAAFSGAT